jgi:hypothetical protein
MTDYFIKLEGITKREFFAIEAMKGLLSNPEQVNATDYKWAAKTSIEYADALLKELKDELPQ